MVGILLQRNKIFADLVASLSSFPDLDKMLGGLTTTPKTLTAKTAKISIDTLIFLKQTLKVIPSLATALHDFIDVLPNDVDVSKLMQALHTNLTSPVVNVLQELVDSAITESTNFSKSAHEMRHQECFALKAGLDGLLDVARKSFLQTVEDIHEKVSEYSEHYKIPIKVVFTASRGYHMCIPSSESDNLPPLFVQCIQNKRSINCTSDEIASLTDRSTEAINKALIITNNLIQELLDKVRNSMDFLFSVTDSVALLDMIQSFATLIAYTPHPYTRPKIQTSGPLVISAGRHPIISMLPSQSSSFVGNDTYLDKSDNMLIITGANGSGKTVYIKQVALIVILAQIGCYVPAEHATIPIRDKILSRIGTYDDMENNISTFYMEMTEASYIVDNLTEKSLVIIDELGRGTSNIDGISLAFAIGEYLALSGSMTLFVTHYPQLTQMNAMYNNIRNIHFKIQCTQNANDDDEVIFLHSLGQGTCDMMSGYGIHMARICGFPENMLVDAKQIQTK
jgi:DNA mismatch repair protein MSH4